MLLASLGGTLGLLVITEYQHTVHKQHARLGMPYPVSGGLGRNIEHLAFHKAMLARDISVWEGLRFA